MAITTRTNRGFALLIAVIFMSVMLTLGLGLSSLGYKQEVLASSVIESQYAFYVADAVLECALYFDQKEDTFSYNKASTTPPALIECSGVEATRSPGSYTADPTASPPYYVDTQRFSLDSGKHCADITVYKYKDPDANNRVTYIFSEGYNAPCSTVESPVGARFVSRGIDISY